jgi:hypothetical protein
MGDRLEEAVGWLWAEKAIRREVDTKLQALWSSIAGVRDLVLERLDWTSSLVATLSSAVELIEDHMDTMATNRYRWDTRSVLVATMSHSLS